MAIIREIRRKLPILKNDLEERDTFSLSQSPQTIDTTYEVANASATPGATVINIPIDDIIPNRAQPRSTFNQNAIARLADSIRRYGILQPLTVRKVLLPSASPKNVSGTTAIYELVAGERRLRAAKLAELVNVPCIVINTDDATSAELAIIENLLRENLNMFEQAEAFQRLIREFHLTQDEAARRVSMSQSAVANKLRILRLLPEERQKILEAGLTERHARALLKINDLTLRGDVLQHILDRKLNVSATETYIDNLLTDIARYQAKSAAHNSANSSERSRYAFARESKDDMIHESMLMPQESVESGEEPLPSAIRDVMARRHTRFKGSIKDLQLFYNSIQNAINILESAGISGKVNRLETDDEVKITIVLSKAKSEIASVSSVCEECFT